MAPKFVMYIIFAFLAMLTLSEFLVNRIKNKKVLGVICAIQTFSSVFCIVTTRSMFIKHLLNWRKNLGEEELDLISDFDKYLIYILIVFAIILVLLLIINLFMEIDKKTALNFKVVSSFSSSFAILSLVFNFVFDVFTYKFLINICICNLLYIPFTIYKIRSINNNNQIE